MTEYLHYPFFGYALGIAILAFSLSDNLSNPKIYRKFFSAAVISLILGLVLELLNLFSFDKGFVLFIMSIPLIYLTYFYVLRNIFIALTGYEPYITSQSDYIGGETSNGFWTKTKKRKITRADFIFSLIQTVVPILTIGAIMIWIVK